MYLLAIPFNSFGWNFYPNILLIFNWVVILSYKYFYRLNIIYLTGMICKYFLLVFGLTFNFQIMSSEKEHFYINETHFVF
jgi:hypothetical protein